MRTQPNRGSHLPVLMKIVSMTHGPIVELGCGIYSTAFLHWACYPSKRPLLTYESNARYYDYALQFACDFHEVRCILDWDTADLSGRWNVAFVDHAPDRRRVREIARLAHATFVVVHDTENKNERKYRYSTIFDLFKYRYKYRGAFPHTSVFSNSHNVTDFVGSWP